MRRVRNFFALLLSACSTVVVQKKTSAEPHTGTSQKMARRQTETTYLKAVLFWLQEYWTH
jgi:hypothetical protein